MPRTASTKTVGFSSEMHGNIENIPQLRHILRQIDTDWLVPYPFFSVHVVRYIGGAFILVELRAGRSYEIGFFGCTVEVKAFD